METHHWLEQRVVGRNKRRSLEVQDMQVLRVVPLLQSSTGTEDSALTSPVAGTSSALPAEAFLKPLKRAGSHAIVLLICWDVRMPCQQSSHAQLLHECWAMLSGSCLCRDHSQMDRGPEALGLKDTHLLTLQETGGPRSNPQIHTFLPNPPSASFMVWVGNAQKVYGKGAGEKPWVGYLVLSFRI